MTSFILTTLKNSNKILDEEELDTKHLNQKPKVVALPVRFHRAVCIHSSLQFVDLVIQSLMFSHGFSSTPVILSELENDESENNCQSLKSLKRIRKELREMFRSHHRNSVSEVAIIIGTSPVKGKYFYNIPINICEAEDSNHHNCGNTCAELNDNERRRINRDLFMLRQTYENPKDMQFRAKNNRFFVFVKGSDEMVNEEVEENEPIFSTNTMNQYIFIHDKCNCEGVRQKSKINEKWLRIVPFVIQPKCLI